MFWWAQPEFQWWDFNSRPILAGSLSPFLVVSSVQTQTDLFVVYIKMLWFLSNFAIFWYMQNCYIWSFIKQLYTSLLVHEDQALGNIRKYYYIAWLQIITCIWIMKNKLPGQYAVLCGYWILKEICFCLFVIENVFRKTDLMVKQK